MTLLYKLHYKTYEFNHFFKFFHHKIKKHSLKLYNLILFNNNVTCYRTLSWFNLSE